MRIQSKSLLFTPLFLFLSLFLLDTAFAQVRVGGFQPVDPKDLHVVEIGHYAVDTYNKQAHTNLKFVTVVNAERQIVQGTNYRLNITVVNGRVTQTYEALVFEGLKGQRVLNSFKIITPIRTGAFQPVDPNDPHVVEIARYAVNEHNKQAHTNLKFLTVFRAESQIVNGRNFKLTIRVANGTTGFRTTYEALVYEGLKGQRVLKYFKAILWIGGFQPVNLKDPHVVEVARYAVDAYNKQAHTNLKFLNVVEGESQLVAGTNYNLTVRVANGGRTQTYVAFVYEPLRGQKQLKSFKIINGVGNNLGGFKPVDPRDPHVVETGRYAVDQYNKQAHKTLTFKKVIQAQVQTVNGRNYKLTITVSNGGTYEALVYEALNGQRTLKSFKAVVPIPGGFQPADPKDPHVVDIGRYAVYEYNNRTHRGLKFVNVIKAETQVVSGVNYRLVITARNRNDQVQTYEAEVLERAWEGYRNLTNFKPLI